MRAFERLHPADGFTFRIALRDPAVGRARLERRGDRRRADGRRPHLRARRRPARARRASSRGTPTTSPPSLRGGFVICADGDATRFEPPTGLEALAVVPGEAVRTRAARAALPGEVPLEDAVFNVAHGALLTLGLARGDWDLLARGLQDRLHQQRRAHLYPRSFELAGRARELGALGATISGAGPTVLVWCFYEQTGTVAEALARRGRGLGAGAARAVRAAGRLRRGALSESPARARRRRSARRAARPAPARAPCSRPRGPAGGRGSSVARSADSA